MIGRLVGTLVEEDSGTWIVDVGGIGYELQIPAGSLARSGMRAEADAAVTLHVHTHVREDALELFGFGSSQEKGVFKLLVTVPNVGPRSALAILSSLPPKELAQAVQTQDAKTLTRIPGVGKKTAERLVLELADKLEKLVGPKGEPRASGMGGDAERLAGALTNMGYRAAEADKAIRALGRRVGREPLSDLLKAALAQLS